MRRERRWRPRARAERGRYRQREGIRSRRRDGVERTETCKKGRRGRERGRRSTQGVAGDKWGNVRRRSSAPKNFLARLRRKRADIVLAILFGYIGNKSKVDPCRREAERVRVKEDRRHIGKTAGAHANLLVTSFRERRAWKQCDRRRSILGDIVWVRWRRERGRRSTQEVAGGNCGNVLGRSYAPKTC